jgi:hypothetical protein
MKLVANDLTVSSCLLLVAVNVAEVQVSLSDQGSRHSRQYGEEALAIHHGIAQLAIAVWNPSV